MKHQFISSECRVASYGKKKQTLNSQLPTPNSQLPTLNSQLSTLNSQLSTLNSQLSTLNSLHTYIHKLTLSLLFLLSLFISIPFSLCLINCHATAQSQLALEGSEGLGEAEKKELRIQVANAPAYFIENKGQTTNEVKYYFKGNDTVYFTDEGVVFRKTVRSQESGVESRGVLQYAPTDAQPDTFKSLAYRLDFVGAKPTAPEARNKQKAKVAYFKGNDRSKWHTDIPTYQEIVYPKLYSGRQRTLSSLSTPAMTETGGIDLVYKGIPGGMKYEFIVQPGADPNVIRLAYTGIDGLSIDDTGNLIIHTGLGNVRDTKPYCYQEIDGKEVAVGCNFRIHKTVGAIHELPLQDAIVPQFEGKQRTLSSLNQRGKTSLSTPYPSIPDSQLSTHEYGFDLAPYNKNYPLIIDPGLEYSTFLGGSGGESSGGIAVDGSGNVYVTGWTESSNFPTITGAFDTTHNGGDAFVTKLTPSGGGANDLLYSTFLGGSGGERGYGIAVDGSGNAYVAGNTSSTDFPTTPGAYDTNLNNGIVTNYSDVFVTKLTPSGTGASDLLYSTFLGGSSTDYGNVGGIAVDGSGNVYVTGRTESSDFPTTPGAYDTSYNGGGGYHGDVFVAKLTPLRRRRQ